MIFEKPFSGAAFSRLKGQQEQLRKNPLDPWVTLRKGELSFEEKAIELIIIITVNVSFQSLCKRRACELQGSYCQTHIIAGKSIPLSQRETINPGNFTQKTKPLDTKSAKLVFPVILRQRIRITFSVLSFLGLFLYPRLPLSSQKATYHSSRTLRTSLLL